jgi:hypothetical protein
VSEFVFVFVFVFEGGWRERGRVRNPSYRLCTLCKRVHG